MSVDSRGLLGAVCLVTGAGSGIGRSVSQAFVRCGCHTILVDRDEAGLEATIEEVQMDPKLYTKSVLDVLDDQAVEQLVEDIPKQHGRLDFAINCAGINGKDCLFHDEPMDEIDKLLNINVRANIVLNRAEVKAMLLPKPDLPFNPPLGISALELERRTKLAQSFKGAIVNVASECGYRSIAGIPGSYTISKHAMVGLTRVMGVKYGPLGIRTNGVAPGLIHTPMTNSTPNRDGVFLSIPQRRIGYPHEIADLALYLCSPESSYVNGETVLIDGGSSQT
ncbi:NAD(P)-binding protein [Sistotremastrum suecicum HHB10207 ss-3]|uniref:NAD(P)-binding protein n=1 Tax=Sistotremastrum suecicum HHB10207 ss-3 TaxID=1314776 RepID=A0A165YZB0_9AGAM|nr:NAD(P)-binding protein [Sistotremastrum suecicum HHB10207 ss-3]